MTTPSWVKPEKIVGWVIPGIVYIITLALAYGDLKSNDRLFEQRLMMIEKTQQDQKSDHDILIEIRANQRSTTQELTTIRGYLERQPNGLKP